MLYFSATIFSLILFYLNVSLLPHVWPILAIPTLMLPFLVIYALKDRTIFPFLLAFIMGVLYDGSMTAGGFPVYVTTFMVVALSAKVIFANLTNYGVLRTTYVLTLLGVVLFWVFSYQAIVPSLSNIFFYVHEILNLFTLLIVVFIMYHFGARYFDYVEKKTSERFR